MRASSVEIAQEALDEEQQEKLVEFCAKNQATILKIYVTIKHHYVVLHRPDPYFIGRQTEETRYWYEPRGKAARWKLVG